MKGQLDPPDERWIAMPGERRTDSRDRNRDFLSCNGGDGPGGEIWPAGRAVSARLRDSAGRTAAVIAEAAPRELFTAGPRVRLSLTRNLPQARQQKVEANMRLGSVILVIWLIIGLIATGQRGYFNDRVSCASAGTVIVTILAGPLNYIGVNPKLSCH